MQSKRFDYRALLARFWRDWGKPVLMVVLVLCSLRSAVADWNDVPTGSMKPTILEGDRIFVNKLAYGLRLPFTRHWLLEWSGPQRGDVVVLFSPDTDTRLVKRVVGLPGDRLEIRDNRLYVNGLAARYAALDEQARDDLDAGEFPGQFLAAEQIDEQAHPIMLTPGCLAPRSFAPVTVPEDQYFVMGDNRDQSRDSRFFGFVSRDKIVGRSSFVVLSVDPDHYYLPRWRRFFQSLP